MWTFLLLTIKSHWLGNYTFFLYSGSWRYIRGKTDTDFGLKSVRPEVRTHLHYPFHLHLQSMLRSEHLSCQINLKCSIYRAQTKNHKPSPPDPQPSFVDSRKTLRYDRGRPLWGSEKRSLRGGGVWSYSIQRVRLGKESVIRIEKRKSISLSRIRVGSWSDTFSVSVRVHHQNKKI